MLERLPLNELRPEPSPATAQPERPFGIQFWPLLLAALTLLLLIGLATQRNLKEFTRRGDEQLKPWSSSRYDGLAAALDGVKEASFTTDMMNRNGNMRIFAVSYAIVPTHLRIEASVSAILAYLKNGGVNICDFDSPEKLETELSKFKIWAKESAVKYEIEKIRNNLAIIRTFAS